jgi:small conductance mechanosensitive channel
MSASFAFLKGAAWLGEVLKAKPAKLVLIVLAFAALMLVISVVLRVVLRLARGNGDGSSGVERRAKTIGSVTKNTVNVVLVTLCLLAILSEMGVNIGPLLAGASIVGVALGFGAQALVKDALSGFFMLLESQYGVGDIINIDGTNIGTVERMTLRITVLRDLEGRLHYIPNGSITRVVVLSAEVVRALVDVEVGHEYDVDKVMAILRDIGGQMQRDAPGVVLEPTETKGVEAITPSAYVVRTLTTCTRSTQWDVAREYRRRILARFKKEGIKIPAQRVAVSGS